ncbi:hypothetical protein [Planctomyces sp. SH-PL14]|uniref:hypothetical protein n=1 Tax=Planctomyces sp. SH-PL14 TaxID=1632864 RepID=UPI00078D1733|nr:hypothetical protein [Planctomyces sp. SH-PL14]AMV21014.1 hypothetical protein VT03_24135 [Planctomyces sp. SH-PL14]
MLGFQAARVAVVSCLLLHGVAIQADEPKPVPASPPAAADIAAPSETDLASERMKFMTEAVARYSAVVPGKDKPLTSIPPCLRWNNPISGSSDGIVTVLTDGGRPAMIVQFFKTKGANGNWVHEFAVTGPQGLKLQKDGQDFWEPSEFILAFKDVPDAPEPADTPARRLAQMRRIAERFSLTDHHGYQDNQIVPTQLRLLSTPLYRYKEEGKITDGVLFAFVMGTDPECNVLIEAQQDSGGTRYRYAFAPMSIYQLEAELDGQPAWSIERRKIFREACRKYYAGSYQPAPAEKVP